MIICPLGMVQTQPSLTTFSYVRFAVIAHHVFFILLHGALHISNYMFKCMVLLF